MINQFIWEFLAQDTTDEDQTAFNDELIVYHDGVGLTDINYLEHWKSLKTLLGDSSDSWASNRIKDRQEANIYVQSNSELDELPAIFISQNSPFLSQGQNLATVKGTVRIKICTQIGSNSFEAIHLAKRIKRLFYPINQSLNLRLSNWCNSYVQYGVQRLELILERAENIYANSIDLVFACEFIEIW